jgi:hypothetical protein
MSEIESARYTEPDNSKITVVYTTHEKSIPANESNRHYIELMEWVGEGGMIEPYQPPPPPPVETDTEKMERVNGLTVAEMRVVLGVPGSGR